MPDTLSKSDVETDPEVIYRDPGDHDKFRHYCPKEQLLAAQVEGKPVMALCGKLWLPTDFASSLPTCPDCQREYDKLDATSDSTLNRNS